MSSRPSTFAPCATIDLRVGFLAIDGLVRQPVADVTRARVRAVMAATMAAAGAAGSDGEVAEFVALVPSTVVCGTEPGCPARPRAARLVALPPSSTGHPTCRIGPFCLTPRAASLTSRGMSDGVPPNWTPVDRPWTSCQTETSQRPMPSTPGDR